jgi:hypothetical protein
VRVDLAGVAGPTRAQAAGSRWRQTSIGLYVPSSVDESVVEQRILEQASRMRRYGAVTAWAALRWHGAAFFDGTTDGGRTRLPVPLVVGRSRLRPDPRVSMSEEQLAPSERVLVDDVWVTTVQRALFDEVRRTRSVWAAVVAIEMAAAARLISVRRFGCYVEKRPAWTGVPFVRTALLHAIDHSRSPQETLMRLCWLFHAALPPPLCNQEVFDLDGRLLGVPDLFDPVAGLVGEYDGADHKEGERHRADVAREERFRDHGLEYFEIVRGDLHNRHRAAQRMLNARSRAKFLPPESRAWTLARPPWRPAPESLDDYLERKGLATGLTTT